ncbi:MULTISPECIES: hypothetical protein [Pseudoalteromonas]|uniref:Uncharacterized protein n=1 Tax=Pseudoalteromonas fuliginea TaxID=1872678 RepID=A0ABQ6RNM5_9GAMM|nr:MULTISPECIES: hypothetical protein [Pseudoalteromonas]KAA1166989.1 hypothetical protein EU509_00105 [Pseudoalteromonas fuliginea]KAA1170207.1 hypothetical protein EUZ79_00070 [Pseudoalteromonas fuliginea]MDQ2046124.1 hypothetical protein [Pseudoalteromonas sp. 20-92]
MSKFKIPVKWIENQLPVQPGLYFVASRYKTGFGSYDYMDWDGEQWLKDESITVVGWVALCDFLKLIDAGWPLGDDEDKEFDESFLKYKSEDDGGFVEVK